MKKLYLIIFTLAMCIQLYAQELTEVKVLPQPSLDVQFHGSAIAIDGNQMVASSDLTIIEKNFVRSFNLENNNWIQNQLIEKDNNEFQPWTYTDLERNQLGFGSDLDISGDWLIVAADHWFGIKGENDYLYGSLFIYKKENNNWNEHTTIYGPNQNPGTLRFGANISIQNNWLVVGAPGCYLDGTNTGVGKVFIYQYDEINDTWEFFQSIIPNTTVSGERFGEQVKIDNNKLIVTSYYKTLNGNSRAGAVYFYEFDGATWGNEQEFTLENTPRNGYFGKVASLSGNYAIATFREDYTDKVRIFKHDGAQWNAFQDIDMGNDIDINAGSMDGNFFVISDHEKWYNGNNTGVAYLYGLENETWNLIQAIAPSDGESADQFGNDVYLKGGKIAIGARYQDDPEMSTGAVYVYSGFTAEANVNAYFRADPMITNATSEISFIDMSSAEETEIVSWSWDFDSDGFEDSNEQNPTHSYASRGTYPVTLTVSDGTISSSITRWVYNFSASYSSCISYIPFQGTDQDGMGIAGWNSVNVSSPDPIAIGHPIPGTELADTAYYYLASRDWVEEDNFAPAMTGNDSISNWPNLSEALNQYGFSVNNLSISFGLMTLGDDIQDADWSMVGLHEYRTYTGGTYYIKLNGEHMITGEMPRLDIHIAYNSEHGFPDEIVGKTNFARPINDSNESSDSIQAIADAFLTDCENAEIKLIFGSITPAIQTEFHNSGRIGGIFDVDQAFLIKGCDCWLEANAGEDVYTTSGHTVMLDGYAYGGANVTYRWSPGTGLSDSTIANPTVVPDSDATYVLTVTSENGCISSDTVQIFMLPYDIHTWEGKGEWDNADHWSHEVVPPDSADIFVESGTLVVDEDVQIQTLYIQDGVKFSIAPNVTAVVDTVIMLDEFAMIDIANYETGTGYFINETPDIYASIGTRLKNNTIEHISFPLADSFDIAYYFYNCELSEYNENETVENRWNQLSYSDIPAIGKGYAFYHEGTANEDTIVDLYGRLNVGTIEVPVTKSGNAESGWNFLGNPYPCKIDWTKNDFLENLTPAIYSLKSDFDNAANYGVWLDGISINGQSPIIEPIRGFFVRATENGSTFFTPEMKTSSDSVTQSADDSPLIKLKITDTNGRSDETAIRYKIGTSFNFDDEFDAYKIIPANSESPQLFTSIDEIKYAINSFANMADFQNFSLNIWAKTDGILTLSISEISGFHNLRMINAETFEQYSFTEDTITLNLAPNSHNRFQLLASVLDAERLNEDLKPIISLTNHTLRIFGITSNTSATLINISGQVFTKSTKHGSNIEIENIPNGIYVLKITDLAGNNFVKKIAVK